MKVSSTRYRNRVPSFHISRSKIYTKSYSLSSRLDSSFDHYTIMPEYASPLNDYGLRCVNSSGLAERLSSLLHISGAIIIPPNSSTVVTSGQTGYSADMTYPSDLKEEVMNAFQSVEDQLLAAGVDGGFKCVYRMTSYHTGMGDDMMEALDAATGKYFGENRPAWAGVGVSELYGRARIEITAMAVLAVKSY